MEIKALKQYTTNIFSKVTTYDRNEYIIVQGISITELLIR